MQAEAHPEAEDEGVRFGRSTAYRRSQRQPDSQHGRRSFEEAQQEQEARQETRYVFLFSHSVLMRPPK